jgi:predicted HicB family RNase H-like nuclease
MNLQPPIPDPHDEHDAIAMDRRKAQRRQHERRVKERRMIPNLEVTPEIHVLLQEKAEQQGKTLDQYLRELIEREVEQ